MPDKSNLYKLSLLFVILSGAALLFYTNYRAATLSITHDEGVIYRLISENSARQIFHYVIPMDHMINSLLMKFSCQLLPDSEYTVRLPNLLGHLLYVIFSILLLLKLKNPHLLAAGFILLNFNPYLLDFFSAARGYGLSVSFMMVSIYFGFSFIQSRKILPLILSFIFAILSVLSVYTLLNYFFALCGVVVIMMLVWWANERFNLSRSFLSISGIYLFIIAISAVLIYLQLREPLLRMQSENFIYQDVQANIYSGTIRPIIYRSIYNSDPVTTVNLVSYGVIAVYFMALVTMVVMCIRRNFSFTKRLIFFSFVISSIVALSISMQYELFNVRFLQNRTATFTIPLMVLTIIGLIEEFSILKMMRIPALIMAYALAALFFLNTAKNVNIKWYLDWQYDSSTREMMHDLKADASSMPAKEIKLGICWQYEPSVNFYRKTWNLDWLKEVDRNGYDEDFDYFYVDNVDSILRKDIFKDKIIIKSYSKANTVLLRKVFPNEKQTQ